MNELIDQLMHVDGQSLLFIQEHLRFAPVTPVMTVLSRLGDAGFIWIVITLLLLIPRKTRRAGILSALAMAAAFCITNLFLKNYVARIRPYEVIRGLHCLVPKEHDLSFPSGHATASFAAAVAIYKSRPKRLGVPCLILAFAISVSRLYVGVHYPTDVICGAVIGTLVALIMFGLFGEKRYKQKAQRARKRKRR